jgi:hypothetical protein
MNSTMWKIALRTLARDKTYALINVAGLALAIACCLSASFAFRASINPGFLVAALAGLGIAYLTVALQSLKGARAHPVRALRYE